MAIPSKRENSGWVGYRRRRSRGERILRSLIGLVVIILVLVAALGYGYFRYQWAQVASAPCDTCVAAANGAPYNILLIGSDSRAGETAAEAQQFGSDLVSPEVSGWTHSRSSTSTPRPAPPSTLSIPRDTFVTITGSPSNSQPRRQNKINAAFSAGPDATVKTIENTFGIPISHYIIVNFFGLEGRRQRGRRHLPRLPLPRTGHGLLVGRLQQQLGPRHPDGGLPGAHRRLRH